MSKTLTAKQERFVEEYVKNSNATQAAIKAGYSKKNADKIGHELLGKTGVKCAIKEAKAKVSKKCGISTERNVKEYQCIAFLNIMDVMDVERDGSIVIKSLDEMPESAQRSISEITQFQLPDGGGIAFKVKFYDKLKALRDLGQMNGDFIEKHEHNHSGSVLLIDAIEKAQARRDQI